MNKGDIGGFVEWEQNLSQRENDYSWVGKDAVVMGRRTRIEGATKVTDDAIVQGDSHLSGSIQVSGDADLMDVVLKGFQILIYGKVKLYEVKLLGDGITVSGKVKMYNVHTSSKLTNFRITGNASIEGNIPLWLNGNKIFIRENVEIEGGGEIKGNDILISGKSKLKAGFKLNGNKIRIQDFALIVGDVRLGDNCTIKDLVELTENEGSFSPIITDIELSGDVKLTTGDIHEINT